MIKNMINPLFGFFLDLIFLPVLILVLPTALYDNNPKKLPAGTKRVTLCVHGFLHNRSAWIKLKPCLESCAEAGPVFTMNLGHPFQSIEDYTKLIQKKIIEIKAILGLEELEINLVGHSMGGLVCANYAVKYAELDHVQVVKLITIASPLQGTYIAHAAKIFCKCAEEMTPASEFIIQLNDKMKDLKDVSCYSIGFGGDVVVPNGRTYFTGRKNDSEIPYLGHVSALYSPSVCKFLHYAIQDKEK